MSDLLPVNTRVSHFDGGPNTHGNGTIIAYNSNEENTYIKDKFESAIEIAAQTNALNAIVDSFYSSDKCPYVVKWDNGYQDVYERESVNKI